MNHFIKITAQQQQNLNKYLLRIISETNGITLIESLELCLSSFRKMEDPCYLQLIQEFIDLIYQFHQDRVPITPLLSHPVAKSLFIFFRNFPKPFLEEHIHLTGSLSQDFIYPRLKKLLSGPHRELYEEKIKATYGESAIPIKSAEHVLDLISLKDHEGFGRYLEILQLGKLVLINRFDHQEAAYHIASELYYKFNVGKVRLKFTLSRATQNTSEQIPGLENLSEEDVVLGLYDGFKEFQNQVPEFDFVLSPSFRKEVEAFDPQFKSKKDHFMYQIDKILELRERYPKLQAHLTDVDTVGDERALYRKHHFNPFKQGFRKLHYLGFSIRSHHGETWNTLKKGIQAVDNAFNIWHIDTLEHGLSLGINPHYYFHSLFERVLGMNQQGSPLSRDSKEYNEIIDMDWSAHPHVKEKLLSGVKLDSNEIIAFTKTKFHTAREVEHYQHDVLNRMIQKNISLIALPSSNSKLTGNVSDYKDHPFSWWEKKGVQLGIGTDNYITLKTNFIQELIIVLLTDAFNLKITKLLMVATGVNKRPYLSQCLWTMRDKY